MGSLLTKNATVVTMDRALEQDDQGGGYFAAGLTLAPVRMGRLFATSLPHTAARTNAVTIPMRQLQPRQRRSWLCMILDDRRVVELPRTDLLFASNTP
jgi:hypothetical protein